MPNEQPSRLKTRLLGTAGFAAGEALLNDACTQYAASRLHYHPALGTPLIGHLNQPFAWYGWAHHYYAYAEQPYQPAGLGAALGTLGLMLGYKLFVGLRMRSARPHSAVHGSARFATFDDLRKTGLIPPPGEPSRGVFCGAYPHPKRNGLAYLRHDGPEHICRNGRGAGCATQGRTTERGGGACRRSRCDGARSDTPGGRRRWAEGVDRKAQSSGQVDFGHRDPTESPKIKAILLIM